MPASRTVGFSVYDSLTRVFPGALVLFFLFILFDASSPITYNIPNASLANIVLLGFLSFIVGEGVHLVRETVQPIPPRFRRVVYAETGNLSHLGPLQRRVQENRDHFLVRTLHIDVIIGYPINTIYTKHPERTLYRDIQRRFEFSRKQRYDLKLEEVSVQDLYTLVLNTLNEDLSEQTRRYRSTYIFVTNLRWAAFGISFFYLLGARSTDIADPLGIVLILIILLGPIIFIIQTMFGSAGRIQEKYVEALVTDFFISCCEEDV